MGLHVHGLLRSRWMLFAPRPRRCLQTARVPSCVQERVSGIPRRCDCIDRVQVASPVFCT